MTDIVDSDELLRRILRARDWAARQEQSWREHGKDLQRADPDDELTAQVYGCAFQAVRNVLDEIIEPGSHGV
ncbi:hypothetical protein [Streptomyces indicus]|uniref:HEPN domain-containing protein n=1 Tax=Streptomyces indicus TaxID=417292 RepID=A0A1G8TDX6_9ACTN|nr:hypothetical protein [Streptomyces indicus]SDJ39779.1 hypothetical protein SAMN05421806_101214 [Streptomyces indicus]